MSKNNGLTVSQHRKLKHLEQQIAQGAAGIYDGLRIIHDEKLYQGTHQTFEGYCRERWGMSDRHARYLLQHGQVLKTIEDKSGTIVPADSAETAEKPTFSAKDVLKEAHTREVAGLPESEQAAILAEAMESAPKDENGKPQVTTEIVREIREAMEDPFKEDGSGTESSGQEAQERPPGSQGKGEKGGRSSQKTRTPAEEFKVQRSKTIKTVEAAMRAFDDLNKLRKMPAWHDTAIDECKSLLKKAKHWKK